MIRLAEKWDSFDIFSLPRGSGPTSKYPWEQWSDGSVWYALEGVDYTCKPIAFRDALAKRAGRTNKKVVVRTFKRVIEGEEGREEVVKGIVFQFFPKPEEEWIAKQEEGEFTLTMDEVLGETNE